MQHPRGWTPHNHQHHCPKGQRHRQHQDTLLSSQETDAHPCAARAVPRRLVASIPAQPERGRTKRLVRSSGAVPPRDRPPSLVSVPPCGGLENITRAHRVAQIQGVVTRITPTRQASALQRMPRPPSTARGSSTPCPANTSSIRSRAASWRARSSSISPTTIPPSTSRSQCPSARPSRRPFRMCAW